ncbi:MAG: hypothetical protein WCP79_04585 [Bacillota bacterium]
MVTLEQLRSIIIILAVNSVYAFELVFIVMWLAGRSKTTRLTFRKRVIYAFLSAVVALAVNLALSVVLLFAVDDTAGGSAIAISLFFGRRAAGGMLLLTSALIALSRIYFGEQSSSAVLAGLAIGIGCAWLVERNRSICDKFVEPSLALYDKIIDRFPEFRDIGF